MKRKLTLNRTTLRKLDDAQSTVVAGGLTITCAATCFCTIIVSCNVSCGGTCENTCFAQVCDPHYK